jgi:hypothetical protein
MRIHDSGNGAQVATVLIASPVASNHLARRGKRCRSGAALISFAE